MKTTINQNGKKVYTYSEVIIKKGYEVLTSKDWHSVDTGNNIVNVFALPKTYNNYYQKKFNKNHWVVGFPTVEIAQKWANNNLSSLKDITIEKVEFLGEE